ncbi:MAG: hypothetical protein DMG61_04830 [Acidobacteria bacterium]|nr:MAG: hypothetical protein DMG61_04830 [Acidobacteriota bacterium]PYY17048.1 MAG: hypothetical protein DMG60_12975 [Acidobacteriota bacterium]
MSLGLTFSQLRRDNRITVVLPVKISPHNEPTKVRPACTCEVSARGAKLMKVEGIGEGDILWIARHTRRAKFKVVWIGKSGSDLDGQIGVESLEPEKFIWDDDLRGKFA